MAAILKGIANHFRIFCIYLLYRLVLWGAAPLLPFYFARRISRDRRYGRGFRERLGALPFPVHPTAAGSVWLHAVSVGEVLSAVSLVQELRARLPHVPIYVSCTTVAGRELAELKLRSQVDGLFFAPLDYVRFVRRVLRRLRPSLVVILETEIWPNLWREARRHGASLVVVNGRMSDRAFPRYRSLRWFFSAPLSQANALHVQSGRDRERYLAAGAPPDRVHAGGNLKYDFTPASGEIAPEIGDFLQQLRPANVWIAASTMPPADSSDVDEDDLVLRAFQRLSAKHTKLLLLLVPRRPERFSTAAEKLAGEGIRYVRRSELGSGATLELPGVLLLDTIGELSRLFAVADVVFMGGTLARRGGHNILEPAFFGKAVITGPHMENFAEIAAEFTAGEATVAIDSPDQLEPAVDRLLADPATRATIGERARALATGKRGVTGRVADLLVEEYDRGLFQKRGSVLLQPLATLWAAGTARRQRRASPRSLGRPVISVGNITMGGSGKTPFVEWLTAELHRRGLQPAILTRGYRRRSTDSRIIIPAGAAVPVFRTGDEAQIFIRAGQAHVGIGSDRGGTGTAIENAPGCDVFVLDDGFQHWHLKRDCDIVLIDALDPFGGGAVFPRGRLREPLSGLARADAFVLTRVEPGQRTAAIENILGSYNPAAPIFRAGVQPLYWMNAATGERTEIGDAPFRRVAAFCGLGNPTSFWRSLDRLGLETVFRWPFGDHQSYRLVHLRRLAARAADAGAEALVTTEKDAINFPCEIRFDLPGNLPWLWLKIAMEPEDPQAILNLVSSRF